MKRFGIPGHFGFPLILVLLVLMLYPSALMEGGIPEPMVPEIEWVLGDEAKTTVVDYDDGTDIETVEEETSQPVETENAALFEPDTSGKTDKAVTITLKPGHEPKRVYDGTGNCGYYDADKVYHPLLSNDDFDFAGVDGSDKVSINPDYLRTLKFDAKDAGSRTLSVDFSGRISFVSDKYNYTVSPASITSIPGTITPKTLTITPNPSEQSKVYGTAYTIRATVAGLLQGDTISGGLGHDGTEDVGRYKINSGTLTVSGNYQIDLADGWLTITPKSLNSGDVDVAAIPDQKYTGSAITPDITLQYRGMTLVRDRDYTVSYANNIEAGPATATINGIGNFTGTRVTRFNIPDTTTINIPDAAFRQYLLDHYDWNADGMLGLSELKRVNYLQLEGLGISSLDGIQYCANLEDLYCGGNQLTTLDVSNCPDLQSLDCWDNQLKDLNISNNQRLLYLFCSHNPLKSLDVTRCPNLLGLNCAGCKLTELDLSSNTVLEFLQCADNQLSRLDLTHCFGLQRVFCNSNAFNALDISKCPELMAFLCDEHYHDMGDTAVYGTFFRKYDYDLLEWGIKFDRGVVVNGGQVGTGGALILPDNIRAITDEAYINTRATVVILPEGCKTIGSRAFANCPNLRRISIPDSVSFIADDAFSGSNNVRIATYDADTLDWAEAHGIPSFTP